VTREGLQVLLAALPTVTEHFLATNAQSLEVRIALIADTAWAIAEAINTELIKAEREAKPWPQASS
jgi:hypothetical protein